MKRIVFAASLVVLSLRGVAQTQLNTPSGTVGTSTTGSVGIGTTTPSSQLEVSSTGTTELTISGSDNGFINAGLVLKSTDDNANYRGSGVFMFDQFGQNEWFIGRPYSLSDQFSIYRRTNVTSHEAQTSSLLDNTATSTTSSLFNILNSGYIGIGVNTPLEKLHVDGTVLSNGLKFGMAGRKLEFYENAGSRAHILLYNSANGNIELENSFSGGDAHILLNPDKNVGIGVSAPLEKLHIDGTVLSNGLKFGMAGRKLEFYENAGSRAHILLYNSANGNIEIENNWVGGDAHIILNPDKNVGIGTTDPTSKLEIKASDNNSSLFSIKDNVGGDILKVRGQDRTMYVRSLEVTLLNFPDYVFEKNYPLMPLKEVESYIQANKHLPNIPSAKEIEENGANLGELVKLQMEKIEELTLYMIELQKANEATNKENAEIKKQLEELKMK